jgi:hypothetical protein
MGLGSPGVEIHFPLNPGYELILAERSFFGKLSPLDGMTIALSPDGVTFANSLQVVHSYRQVYASSGTFDLAEEILGEQPELGDPNRLRVRMG